MTTATPPYPPADPATIQDDLETSAVALDTLLKMLGAATEEYNLADEAWLELYDAVAADLRDEYRESGRKSDPAEHVIVSETRRQHRAAYTRWKRAKRSLERVKDQVRAARTVVDARCAQSYGLQAEMKAGIYSR